MAVGVHVLFAPVQPTAKTDFGTAAAFWTKANLVMYVVFGFFLTSEQIKEQYVVTF